MFNRNELRVLCSALKVWDGYHYLQDSNLNEKQRETLRSELDTARKLYARFDHMLQADIAENDN